MHIAHQENMDVHDILMGTHFVAPGLQECNRSRSLQPKEPRGLEPWLLPETRRAELLGSSGCYWNVFAVGTSKGVTNKKCNFTKNSPFFPPASNLFFRCHDWISVSGVKNSINMFHNASNGFVWRLGTTKSIAGSSNPHENGALTGANSLAFSRPNHCAHEPTVAKNSRIQKSSS